MEGYAKYVCSHCTGSTGEEHTFMMPASTNPTHCPTCGLDQHVMSIEAYLRREIEDLEFEVELRDDKLDEKNELIDQKDERIDELGEEVVDLYDSIDVRDDRIEELVDQSYE